MPKKLATLDIENNNRNLVSHLMTVGESLFSNTERTNVEQDLQDLAEFILNNQYLPTSSITSFSADISGVTSSSKGSKRTQRLYDSTAIKAARDLASAMQSIITNPAIEWSKMRFQDPELNSDEEATKWLDQYNDLMHEEFTESNLNNELGKAYQSLVALANMALFVEEKEDNGDSTFNGFRFTSIHISRIAWKDNKDGIVDTIFRKFELSALDAYKRWGDDCPDDLIRALDKEPYKEFSFIHCVYPRDSKQVKFNDVGIAKPEKRPFASVYIATDTNTLVEKGGYYEMPVLVARWETLTGESYGRGPGHIALPDVRTLNTLKSKGLETLDKQVQPPLLVNRRDVLGTLDLRAGKVSVLKDHNGIREFETRADIAAFNMWIQDLRSSINTMFYKDKIQPLSLEAKKERMSQLEIAKKLEEMNSVLGPVLSKLHFELLQPLIVRCFKILLRSGTGPEMPDILKERGVKVEIVFLNQLARSQKIEEVSAIQEWIQGLMVMAQVDSSVLDNVNFDGTAMYTSNVLGVPEEAKASEDQIRAKREKRQQQEQLQQALDAGQQVSDIANNLGASNGQ